MKLMPDRHHFHPVLLLLLALLAAAPARAELILRAQVLLREPGAIREAELRALLPDSLELSAALSLVDSLQQSLHAIRGYHSSRITACERTPRGLEFHLEQGARTRLAALELAGASRREREQLSRLTGALRPGDPVTATAVARTLELLVRQAAGQGYPYAVARLDSLHYQSENALALRFRLERGSFVRFGSLRAEGARATRPPVLERLTGIYSGAPWDERLVGQARERLLRSGLFREAAAPVPIPGTDPARPELLLRLEERPATAFEAALGGGGQSGQGLAGRFRLGLANLFGTARALELGWQRPGRRWQSLELSYREPWPAGLPLALELGYHQQLRDSLFSTTGLALELGSPPGERLSLGLGGGWERTSPGSESFALAERSSLWELRGKLGWSDLARPANPEGGSSLTLRAAVGRRTLEQIGRRELRIRLDGAHYRPLGGPSHLLALETRAALVSRGGSSPRELPLHALFPLGGALEGARGLPVRGHPEEAFRARAALLVSLEYRLLLGGDSRLFACWDFARAEGLEAGFSATERWRKLTLQGLGGGLQLDSRLGLVSLTLAFDPARGPSRARLHLRLNESF